MVSRDGEKIETEVIRLYCPFAQENNQQYTITILPSWLQPYLRRLVNFVITAVDKYVNGITREYHVAALDMGAESDRTFRRYFYRIRSRIREWNACLATLLAMANVASSYKKQPAELSFVLRLHWECFKSQSKLYCQWLEENSSNHMPLYGDWQIRYILAILGKSVLGLGP